ncbi:hypothetical protein KA071_01175, partial [Candidatus Gracilibacteria bacterium]|nr:hypothetical protein [Candidatus Gracilibacteria bacterium]
MASLRFHHRHKKVIHISFGVTAVFLGILYLFFSAGGASAAITVADSEHVIKVKELAKKNVNTLNTTQIDADKAVVNTTKTALESQMLSAQDNFSNNRKLQIELYTRLDILREIANGWKETNTNFTKYKKVLTDLTSIEAKITASDKDSDKEKKVSLETSKTSLLAALTLNINAVKDKKAELKTLDDKLKGMDTELAAMDPKMDEQITLLLKDLDYTLTITNETLTTDIINTHKLQTEDFIQKTRDALKTAKNEKKVILKERSSVKKALSTAASYLTKLTNQAAKLLKQATNTQSNSLANN